MEIKTGVIGEEGIRKDVVCELLSQHGILYEDIKQGLNNKYPCILLIEYNIESEKIGLNKCLNPENIIHIERIISIEKLIQACTGHFEEPYLMDELIEPKISEYGIKILNLIKECYSRVDIPFIQKWYWPNFAEACLIFTHDIDNLSPRNKNGIFSYIKHFVLKKLNRSSNVLEIADIENKNNIKSSFYFFSDYKNNSEFKKILSILEKRGFEIGLHGSLFSYQDITLLKNEIEKLSITSKTLISGERQHCLNFLNPHTWRYLDGLNLEYDLSFFYNDKIGFRCGICHPYHPFDALTFKKFNLIEIPTPFMDFTAIHRQLSENEIVSWIENLEKAILLNNGCLVVNFHNEYFGNRKYNHIENSFRMLMKKASSGSYWIATAKECSQWWKKRASASIYVNEDDVKDVLIVDKDIFIRIFYPDGKRKDFNGISNILLDAP